MKKLSILPIVFIMFLCQSNLSAQTQTYTLTLSQAKEYALQHNKQLQNSKEQVLSSKQKVRETVAQGLPQIDGSLSFMTYFNYEMNFGFGGSSDQTLNINYALLDPGDYQILSALGQMFGSSEPIVMKDQLNGKAQISQLIFSGQYIAGIQTAKIARKLAEQSLDANELDIKENITNSYCVILVTNQTLKILKANIENLQTLLEHRKNMFNAGIGEETDVDQIKIAVNQLINTQKSLERMNQLNYNMLKFQLGVPPDANIILADSLDYLLNTKIVNTYNENNNFDVSANIKYQILQSQVMLNKKQVDVQKWAYAPTIAAYYSYTEKFLTTSFDLNPNHVAGINMSIPIFSSGLRKARVAQAKINLDISKRNLEMMKDQLEIQKKQLLYNYQNAFENYLTQKENVAVAERVFNSYQNKFRYGAISSLELTQANNNFLSAENNYFSAVLTLLQAQTSLDKLFNKL